MTSRKDRLDLAAVQAIRHLRRVRDELEQAGRPDGEVIELSRQQFDDMLNNLGVVARSILSMAERAR
jgi:hypothetical protein